MFMMRGQKRLFATECLLPVKKCPRGHLCRLGCKHVGECSGSESGDGSNGYCTTAVQVTCTCGALVSVSTVCHQIDAYKLVVVGTGVGSRRFEVRVDCVGSVVPRCVETRRKKSILASFAGRSGELVDSGRSKLARRFVQRSGSFNAIWFVDLPNTSDLGRREVAGFVRSKVKGEIEFLNVSATGGTKLPEYPKDVLADMKARGKVGDVSSLVEKAFGGNMERRDQIVWFMGRILTSVEVKALVGGREAWVIPLFVGEQEASQIPAPIPMSSNIQSEEAVDEVDNESAIIAPTAPENLFEVLEDKEAVIDDDELEVDVPLDGAVIADAQELAKKTKKKKKKSKAVEKEEAVVEKALAKIEDPEVQAKAANLCGFEKCKEKLGALAQYCKYCDRKYCMTHRYPEVHSPICAAELKKGAQTSFKNDAKLAAAIGKGQTQGGKSGSLAKEREDAKKRLAEKIKAARK
ncbi:hypothetical protein BCR33DRAFT_60211 [Rhizoclosmatium globosum]|uniref:AN1-type domain-containing protein n=1 Tax=Rhizoclosmatium globosum TaxID=329046 RepID=A0A1Y2CMB3_9FUNG|nr:hypothetical protein BCR33DRAFT_60211 [Rhizoclosmatium globosum]|eukprot:ORY48178.1 hypothetical protein BCR33DRAFT_60211 [Rhizoclosmatium globosum]